MGPVISGYSSHYKKLSAWSLDVQTMELHDCNYTQGFNNESLSYWEAANQQLELKGYIIPYTQKGDFNCNESLRNDPFKKSNTY